MLICEKRTYENPAAVSRVSNYFVEFQVGTYIHLQKGGLAIRQQEQCRPKNA